MAHLAGAAQIHPGAPAIRKAEQLAVVEAGIALQFVQPGEPVGLQGIHLTPDLASADDRHRKGAEVVEDHPVQFHFALKARALKPVVILFTAFEGAVDEDEAEMLLPGRIQS